MAWLKLSNWSYLNMDLCRRVVIDDEGRATVFFKGVVWEAQSEDEALVLTKEATEKLIAWLEERL